MFKKGFTLAEILIGVSIVGIVAAIAAPSLSNMMPDRDKLAVLKAYKNLNDVTQELINDPGYYINYSSGDCIGLACETKPAANPHGALDDAGAKYAHLLSFNFNGDGEIANLLSDGVLTFTTSDQVVWQVLKSGSDHFVSIDIDGTDKGNSCFYSATACKKPDRFQFKVTREGNISGNEPLTKAYLKTRHNTRNRSNDIKEAKSIANTEASTLKAWGTSN